MNASIEFFRGVLTNATVALLALNGAELAPQFVREFEWLPWAKFLAVHGYPVCLIGFTRHGRE